MIFFGDAEKLFSFLFPSSFSVDSVSDSVIVLSTVVSSTSVSLSCPDFDSASVSDSPFTVSLSEEKSSP